MADREFDLAVGKLPPVFDDWRETFLRKLVDDFAGFAASRINRQPEYLRSLRAGHPVCQIARANNHVEPPGVARCNPAHHDCRILKLKYGGMVQLELSPLITVRPDAETSKPVIAPGGNMKFAALR
jgi:hypothetical protein